MAKVDVLDILRAKQSSPLEFEFDRLWIPPIYNYLTPQDIEALKSIATSIRLSSKIQEKYKMIDSIMRPRGFRRFSAGTNRIVYSFLEDTRFVVKIACDKVAMQDNQLEYENQFLLKPFVAKTFYISPCGTVGFSERVLPIKNKEEFKQIAGDVFEILIHKVLGKYVVEDIGTRFFMNYGVRVGFGPVLLDYPYVYKLDGKKLFCNKFDPETGTYCNGEIDYDAGFNHLTCTKCGKTYLARDLQDDSIENKIIIKGGTNMKVIIREGDKVVSAPISSEEVMRRPNRPSIKSNGIRVIVRDGENVIDTSEKKETVHESQETHVETEHSDKDTNAVEDTSPETPSEPESITETKDETVSDKSETEDGTTSTEPVKEDAAPEEGSEGQTHTIAEELADNDLEDGEGESVPEKEQPQEEQKTEEKPKAPRGPNGRFISKGSGSGKEKKPKGPKISSSFIPETGEGDAK